jgi:hypothetical protein
VGMDRADRNDVEPMRTSTTVRIEGVPARIWQAASRTRINGLIWEDTVRTTDMYPDRIIPAHVTSPIDIAPHLDLIQGIPTHVKSLKAAEGDVNAKGLPRGSVDMACAYRLFLLDEVHTHNRLVIGLYDEEMHIIDGKETKVLRYHTVIEIIQSPDTALAYRGGITIEAMRLHREAMSAFVDEFPIDEETIQAAKDRFHPVTRGWRADRTMGLARISNKIDPDQCRPQAQISISDLFEQMATEGDYHGRIVQPNLQVFKDQFHGLPLPFRTTGKDQIFRKPKEPGAKPKKPRRSSKPAPPVKNPDAKYLNAHIGREDHQVHGGVITVIPHGDERTISAKTQDEQFQRRVWAICKRLGGRWIEAGKLWVMTYEQAKEAYRRLKAPPAPRIDPTAMVQVGENPNLFEIRSAGGIPVRALRQPHTNWALRPDDGRGTQDPAASRAASAKVIDAVCRADHDCVWNDHYGNWLVPQDPPEIMGRIATAIRHHP